MNKLIIFDLDGVLIESRDLHYETLNDALREVAGQDFVISREEHLSLFDGLNTTRKLDMLTERKGLSKKLHKAIWEAKQQATFKFVKAFPQDQKAMSVFAAIKDRGWKIGVASNSIRETLKLSLMAIGVLEFVDLFVSNEDVKRTKPYPEMYWKCMTELNALPKNTIIVEDSHIGRQGAVDSGAHLLAVENVSDWDHDRIFEEINKMENKEHKSVPWRDKKLNVLIPMAGAGSRFAQAGYTFPKPLIEVRGKPMIEVVVRNLNIEANYIFVCQKEHYEKYDLEHVLNNIAPGCKIVLTEGMTEGAACTALLAKEHIDSEAPLFFANSDQFVEWNANECMYAFKADGVDGGIMTFTASHPKWSYAKLGEDGFVSEVAEKKVISDQATVGFYYWKHGADFVKYAEQMIEKDIRVNGEFYVAPVFNEAIGDGKKIRVKTIDSMAGIGTPEDLNAFLQNYKGEV
jgi:HAD superfamily hydrolase (TIGR01509 family)